MTMDLEKEIVDLKARLKRLEDAVFPKAEKKSIRDQYTEA